MESQWSGKHQNCIIVWSYHSVQWCKRLGRSFSPLCFAPSVGRVWIGTEADSLGQIRKPLDVRKIRSKKWRLGVTTKIILRLPLLIHSATKEIAEWIKIKFRCNPETKFSSRFIPPFVLSDVLLLLYSLLLPDLVVLLKWAFKSGILKKWP